ncbi:MAG: nitrogenase component 1 [Planctomycetota bacterium]|jgi:nitrogenase molybdenum-iron protein alpha chain|nr:nitrogenase component 1 [Planctomycetota bacterium]
MNQPNIATPYLKMHRGTRLHFIHTLSRLRDQIAAGEVLHPDHSYTPDVWDETPFTLAALAGIRNSVVIVHAVPEYARGSYSPKLGGARVFFTQSEGGERGSSGAESIKDALALAIARHHPQVVFILSPAEDIDPAAILAATNPAENIRIVPIATDNQPSRIPYGGYDRALQAILTQLVGAKKADDRRFVNLVSLTNSMADLVEVTGLLHDLGVGANPLPLFATPAGLDRAANALATLVLNPDAGGYFARGLEERHAVPYLSLDLPIGLRATRRFLAGVGKALGKEAEALAYAEKRESERRDHQLLRGKRVFLGTNLAAAVGLTELIHDSGGEVAGLALPVLDSTNHHLLERLEGLAGTIPVLLGPGQHPALTTILRRVKPDYYFGPFDVSLAASMGVRPFAFESVTVYGYAGFDAINQALQQPASKRWVGAA